MQDKVSVVILTHNRLAYFKKAFESVKLQTYKNMEIIIVDDCSTDGTENYCKNLEGVEYIRIPREEHKNGSYARNLGLKKAKGKYIAFLDDDDEWMQTKIEKQVEKIEQRGPGFAMVYTGAVIEFNDGVYFEDNPVVRELRGDLKKESLYYSITSTSTMLFDRMKLVELGGFDENLNYWQDTELIVRVCQHYKIDYVDELLTLYRENLKDTKRRSNNINGYEEAITYINNKYASEIDKLDKGEKKRRDALLATDLAARLMKKGDDRLARKYLFIAFKNVPTIKNFLKFVLNYTWVKDARKRLG